MVFLSRETDPDVIVAAAALDIDPKTPLRRGFFMRCNARGGPDGPLLIIPANAEIQTGTARV